MFYLTKAWTMIFPRSFNKPDKHECCYRYFISEEHKADVMPNQQYTFNQYAHCTCSVIDLMFKTSKKLVLEETRWMRVLKNFLLDLLQVSDFKMVAAHSFCAHARTLFDANNYEMSLQPIAL